MEDWENKHNARLPDGTCRLTGGGEEAHESADAGERDAVLHGSETLHWEKDTVGELGRKPKPKEGESQPKHALALLHVSHGRGRALLCLHTRPVRLYKHGKGLFPTDGALEQVENRYCLARAIQSVRPQRFLSNGSGTAHL